MAIINFPVMYIPDPTRGRPLYNGQILVGEPDLDPAVPANQKQLRVMQEDGTLVNVTQPFLLSAGGVPVYSGSYVRLDVDGNFSLKILDNTGAQVYYIENAYEGQPILVEDLPQYVAAEFADVANMKTGTALNFANTVDFNDYLGREVSVVVNNSTSGKGGARYKIVNVNPSNLSTLVGGVWVGANHDLGGGLYAELVVKSGAHVDIYQLGAADGVDLAPVLLLAYTNKFKISGAHVCGEVERDKIDLLLISATIDAPNASTDYFLKNVRDRRIESRGHSEIGVIEAYQLGVDYVLSGSNLDTVLICGDLLIDGQNTTTTILGAASGVAPTTSLTVYISDLVEVKNFTTSGIDYRCDAMDENTDCYVGNIKSWGGAGRCVQFGDNTYGVNQVTVEDCPKLGYVSSTGSSEAKGVLIYGRNANVEGNKVANVKNESTSGGEGIYLKAAFSNVLNNRLKNAGSSSDGCITLKGAGYWDDTYADEGTHHVVAANTIEMIDAAYDSKGIGIFDSYTIATNNILRDLRPTRASLNYSEAISIGGSAPVSNVTVSDNISIGWYSFSGDYADSSKGRGRYGDNIKIKNNTATRMAGGYFAVFDPRCVITTRPMTFAASTKTISIDGGAAQNGEFERSIYYAGQTIVISGTASNNGTFTIATADRYEITVVEAVVDESATPTIIRESVNSLQITGNTCDGATTALRNFGGGGKFERVLIDNNDWSNGTYVYRLDVANNIGELIIGAGETYTNITDKDFGTPQADVFYKGVKVKAASGGTMTLTSYEVDYDVAYT